MSIRRVRPSASGWPQNGGVKRRRLVAEERETLGSELLTQASYRAEHASRGTSYLSTRPDPTVTRNVPKLVVAALRSVARNFRELFLGDDGASGGAQRTAAAAEIIQRLPPLLSEHLFRVLFQEFPSASPQYLVSLFFHQMTSSLHLTEPTKVPSLMVTGISRCANLTTLNLRGQVHLTSRDLAAALKGTSQLETLILSGCVKVGDDTIIAASQAAGFCLRVVNLNLTAITTKGLSSLLSQCKNLEVLKMASLAHLSDRNVEIAINEAQDLASAGRHIPLSCLKALKLKATPISDVGLGRFLSFCAPTLERLDISYSQVQRLDTLRLALYPEWSVAGVQNANHKPHTFLARHETRLAKLVISGLPLSPFRKNRMAPSEDTILNFFAALASQPLTVRERFHVLKMGYIGKRPPEPANALPTTVAARREFAESRFEGCIAHLERLPELRKVSLAGNADIVGSRGRSAATALTRFFNVVGRRLEHVDLSEICTVNSMALGGLLEFPISGGDEDSSTAVAAPDGALAERDPAGPPRLQVLVLEKCSAVDDHCATAIGSCPDLRELYLRDTRMSGMYKPTPCSYTIST